MSSTNTGHDDHSGHRCRPSCLVDTTRGLALVTEATRRWERHDTDHQTTTTTGTNNMPEQCFYHADRVASPLTPPRCPPLCDECSGQMGPRVSECPRCGRPVVHVQAADRVPDGYRAHRGRGLCDSCYVYCREVGRLDDYPRLTRSVADTYADWQALTASCGDEEIARRLGLTTERLQQVLRMHGHYGR